MTQSISAQGFERVRKQAIILRASSAFIALRLSGHIRGGCVIGGWSLRLEGICTKRRISGKGRESGGNPFTRGPLYHLLRNPLYIGMVRHKTDLHAGEQERIVAQDVWDQTQTQLASNAQAHRVRHAARHLNLLAGLVFYEDGRRLTPTHSRKRGKAYRYYATVKADTDASGNVRVPSEDLEGIVRQAMLDLLGNEQRLADEVGARGLSIDETSNVFTEAGAIAVKIETGMADDHRALMLDLISQVVVKRDGVEVQIKRGALADLVGVQPNDHISQEGLIKLKTSTVPAQVARGRKMLVGAGPSQVARQDAPLIKAVVRAHHWASELIDGSTPSIATIARREGLQRTYVSRHLPLAFLAPDIIVSILAGEQPPTLTVNRLLDGPSLPLVWQEQRVALGIA